MLGGKSLAALGLQSVLRPMPDPGPQRQARRCLDHRCEVAGGGNKKTPGPHGPAGFVLQMTLARMAAELGQNHGVDDVNDAIFRLDVGLHDL